MTLSLSPLFTLKGCITEPVINQSPFLKVTGSSLNSLIIHLIASFGPARFSPLKKGSVIFPFKLEAEIKMIYILGDKIYMQSKQRTVVNCKVTNENRQL